MRMLNQLMRQKIAADKTAQQESRSTPRPALEEAEPAPTTPAMPTQTTPEEAQPPIAMHGPLAVAFSQALTQLYGGDARTPSNESQAMDEMIAVQTQAQTVEKLQQIIHAGEDGAIKIYDVGAGTVNVGEQTTTPKDIFEDALSYVADEQKDINWVFVESINPNPSAAQAQTVSEMIPMQDPVDLSLESTDSNKTEKLKVHAITILIHTKKVS